MFSKRQLDLLTGKEKPENWLVITWDLDEQDSERIAFEGSKEKAGEIVVAFLSTFPENWDAIAISQEQWMEMLLSQRGI